MADITYQLYVTTQNGRQEFAVAPSTNIPYGYQPASIQDVRNEAIARLQQYQGLLQNPGGTNTQFLSYAQQFAGVDPNALTSDQIAALTGVKQTELDKIGLSSGYIIGAPTATNSSGIYSSKDAYDYAQTHPQEVQSGGLQVPPNPLSGSTGQSGASGSTTGGTGDTVYRDQNGNFYVNGQHITLDQFKTYGINADFVQPGQTVSMSQATLGHEGGLTNVANQVLQGMAAKGLTINPNLPITAEAAQQFMAFAAKNLNAFLPYAQKEISPYYATQLKLAADTLGRSLGFNEQQLADQEKQLEQQYGNQVRNIGEAAAENGMALSGRRQLQEQQLAQNTQNTINQNRRQLAFNEGNAVGQFAQVYGSNALPSIGGSVAPRVLPGQSNFDFSGQSSPFYSLSPSVYSGLTGSNQFAETSAEQQRASQLENLYNTYNAQQRTLTV